MDETKYPIENLAEDEDDGTMRDNLALLGEAVVGHRIVFADADARMNEYGHVYDREGVTLTLDNGTKVKLANSDDCCAYTEVKQFLLRPDLVDHVITGVGTTGQFTRWHIYADLGDVLEMEVNWSCGNPFYYGYGFHIEVQPVAA